MVSKIKEELLSKTAYLTSHEKECLIKALQYAEAAHFGQKRATGEPYIIHPITVCGILAHYNADITTLISALLHDVVEDTNISLVEIEEQFGPNVSFIVDGLTKVVKGTFMKDEYSAINTEKLLSTAAADIRVAIIKLADRLHNMRTLSVKRIEKKVPYANETIIFFSPLAEKLGLYHIQEELEELAFQYLNPPKYADGSKLLSNFSNLFQAIFNNASEKLISSTNNLIKIDLNWNREPIYKSYSILQDGHSLSEFYHIEIITDSTLNCYTVLGLLHGLFPPIEGKFQDFIAIKKGYFSKQLNTTVLIDDMEVNFHIKPQNEPGIFSLLKKRLSSEEMRLLSTELLKDSIKSVQAVSNNPIEFHDLITYELLHKEMTIFTPKMDVILLPEGATVIDFAFSLNPELAKKMSYVKINGETKSITTALNNMDIVEIIALKRNTVHADWLNHAQTSKAMKTIQDSLQQ